MKRPHWEVVGTTIMDSKLLFEVCKGIKTAAGIEALLVLTVAALYLSVVPGSIRADELMTDAELLRCHFKQRGKVSFAVGETVGKLKAIVRLYALHPDTSAGVPLY